MPARFSWEDATRKNHVGKIPPRHQSEWEKTTKVVLERSLGSVSKITTKISLEVFLKQGPWVATATSVRFSMDLTRDVCGFPE